jgi:7-carboxy-7-deazaguanine synthase
MAYAVKEIFYTLQGEGAHAGRPAVFCRFSGCNLWSGREEDRATAVCQFCDTDFVGTDGTGGGKFAEARELAAAIASRWPEAHGGRRFVVCTGGEPLLQMDAPLIDALHAEGFEIAIETNGTIEVPAGVDWVCVSPKNGSTLRVKSGDELKVVYPQADGLGIFDPNIFEGLAFRNFYIQPKDGVDAKESLKAAIQFCLQNPKWHLSLQTHKLIGIR